MYLDINTEGGIVVAEGDLMKPQEMVERNRIDDYRPANSVIELWCLMKVRLCRLDHMRSL